MENYDFEKEHIFNCIDQVRETDSWEEAGYYADIVKVYIERILLEKEQLEDQIHEMILNMR